MQAAAWLDLLAARVAQDDPTVEITRAEAGMLTLSRGVHDVLLHDAGDVVLLTPSSATGGTIASRLKHRVQFFDVQSFGVNESTLAPAASAALAHLND